MPSAISHKKKPPADLTTEASRRAVFAALVELQDQGVAVGLSRQRVADAFATTYGQVCQVEREGLAGEWPPL
jgi:hypothetical protein